MRVTRVWEKPWRGKSAEPGHYAWIIGHPWTDHSDGHQYSIRGYGRTKAEAKLDLKCNKMQCGYKHAKPHKVEYRSVV